MTLAHEVDGTLRHEATHACLIGDGLADVALLAGAL
jgi:hypothetical protein